jgi:signal transduction histidine kinase
MLYEARKREWPTARLLNRRRLQVVLAPTRLIAPVAIPLVSRWATWLLGVGILAFGGGSERSHQLLAPLIVGSFVVLMAVSLLAVWLFGQGWPKQRAGLMLLVAIDIAASLFVLWLEGGWSSAFYELAMTSVMLPSFVFGALGVILASTAFALGFLAILLSSPSLGLLNTQVAALLNPFIVGGVVAVLADLLRRLERATARNLELAAREERWRIAREIHDGVAQQSYMLALGLETAVELSRREDLAALQKSLPPLEKLSRQALLEVRQYVAEGRPLILGERSLGEALAGLGREFSTVTGVAVEVAVPDDVPVLSPVQRNAVYRVAQESLANVFKHAQARHAWVTLRLAPGQLALEIADNGRGIDPDPGDGFGLDGMRRRVVELGGTFAVYRRSEGGTRVLANFPLEHAGR